MRHSPFGDTLRQSREESGRTLQDIAASTKIRSEYLRALEEGDFAVLPERPFARSYLQRYAAELGLEAAPLLVEFDRAVPMRPEISNALRGQRVARRASFPVGALAAVFSGLVVLGALGWGGYAMWRSSVGVSAPEQGATIPLTTERQIRLSVRSKPSGARVYLDNRLLGETPVREFPLEARGQGQLRLELGGHKTLQQNVNLGQTKTIQLVLEQEDAAPESQGRASGEKDASLAGTPMVQATPSAPPPSAPLPPGATASDATTASSSVAAPVAPEGAPQRPPEAAGPSASGSVAPPAGAAAGGITLRFSGRSWVRVTSPSGRLLYEGIPQVGAERVFPAGVTVRVGAPSAVQVRQGNGEATPFGTGANPVTRRFP